MSHPDIVFVTVFILIQITCRRCDEREVMVLWPVIEVQHEGIIQRMGILESTETPN